jgi:hypothetical protein
MPAVPNQEPSKDQKKVLSTERESSSILKGGTDDSTWLYPSPQMVRANHHSIHTIEQ